MSVELIYKTTSAAALEWWKRSEVERQKAHDLRVEYIETMTAEFGPTPPRYSYRPDDDRSTSRQLMTMGPRVVGLASGMSETPPAGSGWRLDSKEKFWAPKLATKEGKARRVEMAALVSFDHRAHMPEIGMPQIAFADGHMYRGGIEFDEETQTIYQMWGSGRCEVDCLAAQSKAADVEWVEVPRSEWFAREETKAAAE